MATHSTPIKPQPQLLSIGGTLAMWHSHPTEGRIDLRLLQLELPKHGEDAAKIIRYMATPVEDHPYTTHVLVEISLRTGAVKIQNLDEWQSFEELVECYRTTFEDINKNVYRVVMKAGDGVVSRAYASPPRSKHIAPFPSHSGYSKPIRYSSSAAAAGAGGSSFIDDGLHYRSSVASICKDCSLDILNGCKCGPKCFTCEKDYGTCDCVLTCLVCGILECKCKCDNCGKYAHTCGCANIRMDEEPEEEQKGCWACNTMQGNQEAHKQIGGCDYKDCYVCGEAVERCTCGGM